MRKPQYLVLYRDRPKAKTRIFGPFVNGEMASRFRDRLPDPLEGGYRLIKNTEPQTFDEADRVARQLLIERQQQ